MELKKGYLNYDYKGSRHIIAFKLDEQTSGAGVKIKADTKKVRNASFVSVVLEAETEIIINELHLEGAYVFSGTSAVFCNGYQSWTDSREFSPVERMPDLAAPAKWLGLKYYGDYTFAGYPGEKGLFHSYTYCYVRDGDELSFAGSLNENSGFTVFEIDAGRGTITIEKDCSGRAVAGKYHAFSLFMAMGKEEKVFNGYFDAMKITGGKAPLCTGWTSWYNYYTGITEKIILDNLNACSTAKIPMDIFQIDDGYQKAVGDWLDIKDSFPRGMEHIARSIQDRGYRAGLWLAPFVCERKSRIFREKRHWVLRDAKGRPVVAGFNPGWSYYFYALDIYHEEVREYLRRVFDTVFNAWGYDMVKLDFLYAAALCPPRDKTRGEVMHDGMKFLRECAGEKLILGCGVPLGSSFGLVDYCRIGSDVALKWEDALLKGIHYRERVSTINSLVSTIGRRHLNENVFLNDPDVFILRGFNNKLASEEKYTLFVLNNLFGGLLFTSDNVGEYNEEEMNRYRSMFPFKNKRMKKVDVSDCLLRAEFSIDENEYIVLSNLSDEERLAWLPSGVYFSTRDEPDEGDFLEGDVDILLYPHTTHCYRRVRGGDYTVAGTTCHIFPGSEVTGVKAGRRGIAVEMDRRFCSMGNVYIAVPLEGEYTVNGAAYRSFPVTGNLFMVKVPVQSL